jgi:hypothetical protein
LRIGRITTLLVQNLSQIIKNLLKMPAPNELVAELSAYFFCRATNTLRTHFYVVLLLQRSRNIYHFSTPPVSALVASILYFAR